MVQLSVSSLAEECESDAMLMKIRQKLVEKQYSEIHIYMNIKSIMLLNKTKWQDALIRMVVPFMKSILKILGSFMQHPEVSIL